MARLTRRQFLAGSAAAGAAVFVPWHRALGASDDIRLAIIGFNGQGGEHLKAFRSMPGVRVVALCDADQNILNRGVKSFADEQKKVEAVRDMRKIFDMKDVDAVVCATPNHWHALSTVWACQAGKDVYVEKPISHSIWEGRKAVEAARKYNRVVQAGTQNRSDEALAEAVDWLQKGNLGKIIRARGFCYKMRGSIGKTVGPQPVPASIDYDLWCGPSPKVPLRRKNLHYDWHWFWNTGNSDIGNQGIHEMDKCRWLLGAKTIAPRVMAVGGRFGYEDDAETPNTQIVFLDYQPAPLIFEVRGLPRRKVVPGDESRKGGPESATATAAATPTGSARSTGTGGEPKKGGAEPAPGPPPGSTGGAMDAYKGIQIGEVIDCEGGYFAGGFAYDDKGEKVKQFRRDAGAKHRDNFIKAVRSRKAEDQKAPLIECHLSSALCHMGNISYRLGKDTPAADIAAALKTDKVAADCFDRFMAHLEANGVDPKKVQPTLGPWLDMDAEKEQFKGTFADQANKLVKDTYRDPFVVPEQV